MNSSRRSFLQKGAIALGAAAFTSSTWEALANAKAKKIVGVQLYSIREDMKVDPMGTLTKLAEMGYKYVEHANYVNRKFYGWSAQEFRKRLDGLGLKMPSGHTVMGKQHWDESKKEFTDLWKYTVEDAAVCGQEIVISPSLDKSIRTSSSLFKTYMDVFNKSGELCQKSGMRFGYHNHDFEFSEKLDGVTLFDLIMENTDSKLVAQQLDIGNMINGGGVPAEILKKYPGRFVSMHVKDEIAAAPGHGEKYESTILGTGIISVLDMVKLGEKKGGTKHFIIEQESYQGKKPIDCVREDLEIMKKWGYVS
ncbi:sugar phosphate isomerase/epimerase family protein [Aquirufa aurantiipilula]|uniref:TIM barrel protein n=1 Tax=Aquirufa aurantiipilula TaxID=2696561 RepID=A0ABT6BFX8_9BACT|nr:TIM barrel protein [Aquirufa aurantiipilula]MBZ1327175.1 sugar phosphate isomerase/epimerase [Aquirufa aurantiipilula]MDF5689259.1 TIM barrel protein [Aquirufa aurantiipilula]